MDKPDWWDWPFDCDNDHLYERMISRGFSEADLREMIENTLVIQPGAIATRYHLYARYHEAYWKIVVEPDPLARVVIVVTAFNIQGLP